MLELADALCREPRRRRSAGISARRCAPRCRCVSRVLGWQCANRAMQGNGCNRRKHDGEHAVHQRDDFRGHRQGRWCRVRCWCRATASMPSPDRARACRATAAQVLEAGGATLMPGMVNTHCHLTYNNGTSVAELTALPVEEHVLMTMHNAKLALDMGFTCGDRCRLGQAAARHRHPQRDQRRQNPGAAHARGFAGADRDRRSRRRQPARRQAPVDLDHLRRPGRVPQVRANDDPRRRRPHQVQQLGRQLLLSAHGGLRQPDDGRRGRARSATRQTTSASGWRPMPTPTARCASA